MPPLPGFLAEIIEAGGMIPYGWRQVRERGSQLCEGEEE